MEIVTLFPTLIYQSKLKRSGSLNLRLIKEITELSKQDKLGRQWSKENYPGGYTSYASLSDLPYRSPTFAQFSEALEPHANQFAKSQGWDTRGRQLRMTSCWINIMPKGTYHTLHLHPHSVISGTYYVSTPPSSVSLKLEDPRMAFYMNAPSGVLGKTPPVICTITLSP